MGCWNPPACYRCVRPTAANSKNRNIVDFRVRQVQRYVQGARRIQVVCPRTNEAMITAVVVRVIIRGIR